MTASRSAPRDFAELDDRTLDELRAMAPTYPRTKSWRGRIYSRMHPNARFSMGCGYCARMPKSRSLVVNPITLRRHYIELCKRRDCSGRLQAWADRADARRRRAQFDWERENPAVAPLELIGHIPPQYPSFSRATLRKFIDSGEPTATVKRRASSELTASALNGSIRSLGFSDDVYAEIRSGEVVVRRTALNHLDQSVPPSGGSTGQEGQS